MNILDEIKVEFRHTGFTNHPKGLGEDTEKRNNYDIFIRYKDRQIREAYSAGDEDLGKQVPQDLQELFKIDVLNHIVKDIRTLPETFEIFKEEYAVEFLSEEQIKSAYDDIVSQVEKYKTIFEQNDVEQIKSALLDWMNSHPESKLVNFDKPLDQISDQVGR